MSSIPMQIHDAAKQIATESEFPKLNILRLFSRKKVFDLNKSVQSLVDSIGSYKNLLVVLGAKNIKPSKAELVEALDLAQASSEVARNDYEAATKRMEANPVNKFTGEYYWTYRILVVLLFYGTGYLIEFLDLNRAYIIAPGIFMIIIGWPVITGFITTNKLYKEWRILHETKYLIQGLIRKYDQI
jgi:hypothetical protein